MRDAYRYIIQTQLRDDLKAETEKNKDDITHLDMLRKHYEEREKAYDVCPSLSEIFIFALLISDF